MIKQQLSCRSKRDATSSRTIHFLPPPKGSLGTMQTDLMASLFVYTTFARFLEAYDL